LRARLIAALVSVVAVVCLVVGVVTDVAMYRFQVDRLDNQLKAAADRAQHPRFGPGEDGGRVIAPMPGDPLQTNPPPFLERSGQGPGTIGAVVDHRDGVITAARLNASAAPQSLPADQAAILAALPVNGKPYTRTLGGRDYRLLAVVVAPEGDVIITGLPMDDVYTARYQLAGVEVGVGLVALLLAALLGALIMRTTMRPLDRVAAAAREVTELRLDRGEVELPVRVPHADPRTEVGQVGIALNRMLRHVAAALAARQASETRVRHFVADASHELRTPLAAIRGYAELTRRVGQGVPPDVAHAMSRVESEAARMTVLVEDLLLLARLDSGRPLGAEPVDLSRLVIDAVSDAHVAGPDHRWRLDLPAESVQVTGDPVRLYQVLANLLANARTHTPPGTTVTTSLATNTTKVVLTVVDDGPGIPTDLLPQVFDRFARGDTSRSRAAGSTGLGLAIVAAVVEAHRGSVGVDSRPGRTALTVRLPAGAQ
jgi:two-component system OmpR family sensor kinase